MCEVCVCVCACGRVHLEPRIAWGALAQASVVRGLCLYVCTSRHGAGVGMGLRTLRCFLRAANAHARTRARARTQQRKTKGFLHFSEH